MLSHKSWIWLDLEKGCGLLEAVVIGWEGAELSPSLCGIRTEYSWTESYGDRNQQKNTDGQRWIYCTDGNNSRPFLGNENRKSCKWILQPSPPLFTSLLPSSLPSLSPILLVPINCGTGIVLYIYIYICKICIIIILIQHLFMGRQMSILLIFT